MERQKGIGDRPVEVGDESGDLADLFGIHVPGYQAGCGDQKRGIRPPAEETRYELEVRQCGTVRDTTQSPVEGEIESLEVELEAAPALQREVDHLPEKASADRTVGLPADPHDPPLGGLQGLPGGNQCMVDLARGVAAEEAEAVGAVIDGSGKVLGGLQSLRNSLPKVPVLAEEAVEGTGLVEDGEVVAAGFGRTRCRADPVGDAVCRQRVTVPRDGGSVTVPASQAPVDGTADAAVARLTSANPAGVRTVRAVDSPCCPGRLLRQSERLPSVTVCLDGSLPYPRALLEDTGGTNHAGRGGC